jgi:hypothetical protein
MSLKGCVVELDAGVFSRFSGTAVKRFFGFFGGRGWLGDEWWSTTRRRYRETMERE